MKPSLHTVVWACLIVSVAEPVRAQPDALEAPAATATTTAESSTAGDEYFEKHIRPILSQKCYSCHSSRANKREGGLVLDSRAGWRAGGDRGAALAPGMPDESLLIQAIRYTDENLQMPPDEPLAPGVIRDFERWVRMGAPDTRLEAIDHEAGMNVPSDPVAGRAHWAFRPLHRPPLPQVQAAGWPKTASDTFVLARLEADDLRPAPDADRRTLLRRTYFLLIGLPPNAQQVAAFLRDNREDAFERLVDQLLDSSHFGERWGRHWLDLARYADSNGLDENFLFREAWRYRNWVIDAFNADLPFDAFLLQQLAGDLLPYESIEQRDRQRTAAGFLVIGPKVLLGNNPQERVMDVADEQLDTIGKAILGQTLGCARCHDHKFDPIPTADYYALAGIMTSTHVMQQRYMLGQQRVMERLVGLGPDGNTANAAYEKYWRESKTLQARAKQGQAALDLLENGKEEELGAFAKKQAEAVAEASLDVDRPREERIAMQQKHLATLVAAATPPSIPPRAMIPSDVEQPGDEAIRLAGQFNRPGKKVPRGFLRVVSDAPAEIPKTQSGRQELAHWLTDVEHGAGSLAARVLANRVWHHLMGRGIVRTVDNLGRTGEAPSHPELLDALASRLIESDWSVKALIREIVLSRSFAMSSRHDEQAHAVDPENRLLWRAHRRRLGPEAFRDAMLAAAGTLDPKPLDSTVSYLGDQATAVGANKNRRRTDFPCRSVYLPVIRNDLPEVFDVFDFADPHATTGLRPETIVATQGLFVLNDTSVMDAARATARTLLETSCLDETGATQPASVRVERMFERILHTRPTNDEREALLTFIRQTEDRLTAEGAEEPTVQAWTVACHALFASSRFQILD